MDVPRPDRGGNAFVCHLGGGAVRSPNGATLGTSWRQQWVVSGPSPSDIEPPEKTLSLQPRLLLRSPLNEGCRSFSSCVHPR